MPACDSALTPFKYLHTHQLPRPSLKMRFKSAAPAIPLWSLYPEKTMTQKDTCTSVFTAALYTIAKTWKQTKCPSTEEQIKKMWYIYTMEYYSAIKRNEIPAFLATWMDLEIIMPSEVSHTVRHQHHMLSLTCGI